MCQKYNLYNELSHLNICIIFYLNKSQSILKNDSIILTIFQFEKVLLDFNLTLMCSEFKLNFFPNKWIGINSVNLIKD
jgi:hypothetical protein